MNCEYIVITHHTYSRGSTHHTYSRGSTSWNQWNFVIWKGAVFVYLTLLVAVTLFDVANCVMSNWVMEIPTSFKQITLTWKFLDPRCNCKIREQNSSKCFWMLPTFVLRMYMPSFEDCWWIVSCRDKKIVSGLN